MPRIKRQFYLTLLFIAASSPALAQDYVDETLQTLPDHLPIEETQDTAIEEGFDFDEQLEEAANQFAAGASVESIGYDALENYLGNGSELEGASRIVYKAGRKLETGHSLDNVVYEGVGEYLGSEGYLDGWGGAVYDVVGGLFKGDGIDLEGIVGAIGGVIGSIFGNDRWYGELTSILSDPCSELPVTFISSPEPGWCIGGSSGGGGAAPSGSSRPRNVGEILANSTGALGIPSPAVSRQLAEVTYGDISSDLFEINPEVYTLYLGNTLDRTNTRIAIESVLGEQGQEQIAGELKLIENAVAASISESASIQFEDVTQDVMKGMARMLAQDSLIKGASQAELIKLRVDTQLTNMNLTNVSRTLDELSRHERTQLSANSAKALFISAQAGLY